MATLDEIFKSEFNKTRNNLKGYISIYDLGIKPKSLPKNDFYNVKGVEVDYYSKLNDSNVMILPRGYELRRRLLKAKDEGGFRTDKDGNVRTVVVSVPKGSVAVMSPMPIGLPFSFKAEGYDYVDYIEVDGKRRYIYILPTSVLYKANFNALALSTKKMKAFSGVAVKTWNMGILNICIVPYKVGRTYESTIILKVKQSLDFSKDVDQLIKVLESKGVISNPVDYMTEEGENIGVSPIDPSFDSIEYNPLEPTSLADANIKGVEDIMDV